MSLSPYELAGITEYLNENCEHNFIDVIVCGTRQTIIECEYCGKSKLEIILSRLENIEH